MSATLDRDHARQLRRLFLGVVTGSFVFLLAWIGYLAVSLPSGRQVHQWRIAWLGFDIALVAAVGITALCAWGRRQIFITLGDHHRHPALL